MRFPIDGIRDRDAAEALNVKLTRRSLVTRVAAFGVVVPVFGSLLAACAEDDAGPEDEEGDDATVDDADEEPASDEDESDDSADDDSGDGDVDDTVEQSITLRMTDDLNNPDPPHITTGNDFAVAQLVYSSLIRYVPGTIEFEGDLAESWDVSDDGLEYTFQMRDDAVWHEGYGDVSAHDAVWSYQRLMDEDEGSRFFADMVPVESIEADGDYTVVVAMNQAYPGFLDAVLAYRPGFIGKQDAIEEYGDDYINNIIGSGPYIFEEWQPGSRVTLSRNPDFYGDELQITDVTFQIVQEDGVAEVALREGDLDAAYFESPEVQAQLLELEDINVMSRPMPRTWQVYLQMQREPFDDVRVRQAIARAINRQAMVDHIFLGQATVGYTPVNPNSFGHLDEETFPYDVDEARTLLDDAGHPDGFPDEQFEFVYLAGAPWDAVAEAIQSDLGEIGINVELVAVERAIYEERRQSNDFDLFGQNFLRIEPSQQLVPYFHSAQTPNPNVVGYDGADDLIDAARFEPDDEERERLYEEAQRQIIEDMPAVPLLFPLQVVAVQPNVQGMEIGLLDYPVWQMSKDSE